MSMGKKKKQEKKAKKAAIQRYLEVFQLVTDARKKKAKP
jgi:hypothetical protein